MVLILTLLFLFSITPTICYSNIFKWILDADATYHVCPKWDWFSSFEKRDGGLVMMGDDHICRMEGISTVLIKKI